LSAAYSIAEGQSMGYVTNLYLVFVDFEKGFDSINRNKVWEVMNRYGIP
jgi:hypothetical protein